MYRYGHLRMSVEPVQSSLSFAWEVSGTANPIGAEKDQKHDHPEDDVGEHDNADQSHDEQACDCQQRQGQVKQASPDERPNRPNQYHATLRGKTLPDMPFEASN